MREGIERNGLVHSGKFGMKRLTSENPLNLPEHLAERVRVVAGQVGDPSGEFVLYWMCTAVRVDENPALDVAKYLAMQHGLPLLVYHGVAQDYPYASDRHHTFILQGARDVQRALADTGIGYCLHVERPGCDLPVLQQLAARSAIIVTEDMPTGPPVRFLRALRRSISKSIVAVDTACVVPMRLVGRAIERAFEYRDHTRALLKSRLVRDWPTMEGVPNPLPSEQLPSVGIDLQGYDVADLVAECQIDHSIGPVVDTVGGSTAGYARWQQFQERGLRSYANQRNDATRDGVSRMSAYLHYGMVSPMRLARQAAGYQHPGAEKYLDELLIWRELAYSFCFYRPDHADWEALPQWAQATLETHADDPRVRVYGWEELARGVTGDPLWDAAQRSLLIHGELHNNVRMTWGKAVLNWTRHPREALRMLIDLNHRYALDGRDPASYGGILWCLGGFDRPFFPEQAITGSVRGRSTHEHAQRLDVVKYAKRTTSSRCPSVPHVAVIGAGLAGAMAARTLADHGLTVSVFEKSRDVGGRMATRGREASRFDHGAQYFTVRDDRFRRYVQAWREQGIVDQWLGEVAVYEQGQQTGYSEAERFVGVPDMKSICRHLLSGLPVHYSCRIQTIQKAGPRWMLLAEDQSLSTHFDRVIVALPAPQAASLLTPVAELSQLLGQWPYRACWAVMATLATPLSVPWNAAFINSGPIRWLARNGTKPMRAASPESLVIHATFDWTESHLDAAPADVAQWLLDASAQALAVAPIDAIEKTAHRWLYALPGQTAPQPTVVNRDQTVIACGDWAGGPRVEGAFLSGMAAAGRVLGKLTGPAAAVQQLQLEF